MEEEEELRKPDWDDWGAGGSNRVKASKFGEEKEPLNNNNNKVLSTSLGQGAPPEGMGREEAGAGGGSGGVAQYAGEVEAEEEKRESQKSIS